MDHDQLVNSLAIFVRGGLTPQQAAQQLSQMVPAAEVADALRAFLERTGRIRIMREPDGLLDPPQVEAWYLGPQDGDRFWPALKQFWLDKGWAADAIDSTNAASTKVVSLLEPPGAGAISTRGLVLGYVQSGKTANFTAVVAKAADVGYRFFIVLSGVTNALRKQTQERLQEELVALNPEHWFTLTTPDRDFRHQVNVNAFLTDHTHQKTLCVVKKNPSVLRRLKKWLGGANAQVLGSCPILVIDDEADQASLNASGDEERRTVINRLLVEMLGQLPKAAYVGYTATPFANFFVDPSLPEDLYPRHFIIDLPRPAAYFGPERIFGREQLDWENPEAGADGLDMIRIIPAEEAALLHPASAADRHTFSPEVTSSIRDAICYYWLATAARDARGQRGKHSTMLVHTSQYAAVHESFRKPLEELRDATSRRLRDRDQVLLSELRALWEDEHERVPSEAVNEQPTSFDELEPHLVEAVESTEVAIENALSQFRLDFSSDGRRYIVVGGNVLARGLTIEGLVVSIFVRTASAYDTLLQMGRWFGYRGGYADLPRVWMTEELKRYFFELATVEQEIRYDIRRYESQGKRPTDFGVRVRTHPQLAITSKLKMKHAVPCEMSYSGSEVQTLVFNHKDPDWLRGNLEAARSLVRAIREDGKQPRPGARGFPVYDGVESTRILEFLRTYTVHEKHLDLRSDLVRGYISAQNARGQLTSWNVAIVTRKDSPYGTEDIGAGEQIGLVSRAAHARGTAAAADVKALMSGADLIADMPADVEVQGRTREALREERDAAVGGRGLLLIYPIAKDSRPATDSRERFPLDAVDTVVGMALVFPDAGENNTPQTYVTVDLSGVARDEVEFFDEEEVGAL